MRGDRDHFVGLVEKSDTSVFRWKSRHVDFSLEKPTRRFFVGKADTSIFGPKSRHVDFSWKRAQFGPEFKLLLFELRSTNTGKSSGSLCTLFICIFWYRFFNYTFIKLIFFNREKIQVRRVRFFNDKSTCRLFQRKIDVSAFPTENRRVGFSNGKSTCRLFQRKIDVSAFSTRPTILWRDNAEGCGGIRKDIRALFSERFGGTRRDAGGRGRTRSDAEGQCWSQKRQKTVNFTLFWGWAFSEGRGRTRRVRVLIWLTIIYCSNIFTTEPPPHQHPAPLVNTHFRKWLNCKCCAILSP